MHAHKPLGIDNCTSNRLKTVQNGVERVESRSSQADSGRVKRWLGWVNHNLNQVQSYTVGPDQPTPT